MPDVRKVKRSMGLLLDESDDDTRQNDWEDQAGSDEEGVSEAEECIMIS